jgi:hypothetical protein
MKIPTPLYHYSSRLLYKPDISTLNYQRCMYEKVRASKCQGIPAAIFFVQFGS